MPKWVSACVPLSVGGEALGRKWEIHSESKVQCGPVIPTCNWWPNYGWSWGSRGCLCKWHLIQPPKEDQSSPKPYFQVPTWFLFLQSFCTMVLAHVINSRVFSIVLFSSFHFYHSKKKKGGRKGNKNSQIFCFNLFTHTHTHKEFSDLFNKVHLMAKDYQKFPGKMRMLCT